MENKLLIDLSVKYGLNSAQLSKLTDIAYQAGAQNMESRKFKRVLNYICSMGMVDKPSEEIMEELRLKGLTI
ncbi:hypothetical protein ACFL21_04745 [Patescibacteria group bacterium]